MIHWKRIKTGSNINSTISTIEYQLYNISSTISTIEYQLYNISSRISTLQYQLYNISSTISALQYQLYNSSSRTAGARNLRENICLCIGGRTCATLVPQEQSGRLRWLLWCALAQCSSSAALLRSPSFFLLSCSSPSSSSASRSLARLCSCVLPPTLQPSRLSVWLRCGPSSGIVLVFRSRDAAHW